MTHGAGAISSGGGGGGFSSGGGFTSTAVYHGGHRRNSRSDDCDDGAGCCFLCLAVGYLVAFLLCITKMKPRTRVALVWFYCILGGGLGGGLLVHRYSSQDITASPLDQREVSGISSVFCQSLSIVSTVAMPSYIYDKKPVVNTSTYVDYKYSTSTTIQRDNYEYWGYFLLRDSMVTVTVCPEESGITLYIIKNKNNLNKWLDDSTCVDCYEERHVISMCFSTDGSDYYYTVSDSDDYYFLLVNNDIYLSPYNSIDIKFALRRTRYDLKGGSLICFNEMDCEIPLVMSSQYFVFDVPRMSPRDTDVTITCEPRAYLYVILFGLIPFVIGVFITVLIIKHAKRKELATRNRRDSQVFSISVTDPEAGVNSFSNPAAQMPPAPPKYAEHPPSYEQLYGTQ